MLQSLTVVLAMLVQVRGPSSTSLTFTLFLSVSSLAAQAADTSSAVPSSLPLIHDAITELARLHWPFFPGVILPPPPPPSPPIATSSPSPLHFAADASQVRAVVTAAAQRPTLHDSVRPCLCPCPFPPPPARPSRHSRYVSFSLVSTVCYSSATLCCSSAQLPPPRVSALRASPSLPRAVSSVNGFFPPSFCSRLFARGKAAALGAMDAVTRRGGSCSRVRVRVKCSCCGQVKPWLTRPTRRWLQPLWRTLRRPQLSCDYSTTP
jgi:hypothetical protein